MGRRQGLRGWRQFKELQDNDSEKKRAVREVKGLEVRLGRLARARPERPRSLPWGGPGAWPRWPGSCVSRAVT